MPTFGINFFTYNFCMKIRNIKRIFWSNSTEAPHAISADTVHIVQSALHEIPIKPFAQLQITEKVEGQRLYTIKLTFKTTDDSFMSPDKVVFYAMDVNDYVWIIGTRTRPYPVITRTVSLPESGEDSQLNTFQVDYSSFLPILYKPAT